MNTTDLKLTEDRRGSLIVQVHCSEGFRFYYVLSQGVLWGQTHMQRLQCCSRNGEVTKRAENRRE